MLFGWGVPFNDGGSGTHEGLSFGGTATPYNWATSPAAADILNEGLFISLDMALNSDSSYISMGFGSFDGVPDGGAGFGAIYDSSNMDWGIRWERDRMISFLADGTTTPSYRTDQDPGGYLIGGGDWFNVLLELQFDGSFGTGTTVTASTTITDLSTNTVVSSLTDFDTFTLGATDDFRFDISSNLASGSNFIDNLIVAVPEPSSALVLGLATLGMIVRRRKS